MNNKILLEAADKFGTPLYIYDSNMIKSQYNRLKQSFKDVENLQINYAVKAQIHAGGRGKGGED